MKTRDPRLKKLLAFRRSDWWEGIHRGSYESESKIAVAERRTPVDDEIPSSFRKLRPLSNTAKARKKRKGEADRAKMSKSPFTFLNIGRRIMFAKEHPNSWIKAEGEDWKLSASAAMRDLKLDNINRRA